MVDTLASGASDRKVVEVQILSWAPNPLRMTRHRRRGHNPHLAYSASPHRCIGASHARLLLRTLTEQIGSRGLKMKVLASEPRHEGGDVYRCQTGYESLRVSFAG